MTISNRNTPTVIAAVATVSRKPHRYAAASTTNRKKRKKGLTGPSLTKVSTDTQRMSRPCRISPCRAVRRAGPWTNASTARL
jgi:hypothetical protein